MTASDRSLLAQAQLFRSLPEAELDRLVETLRPIALPAGAVLFQEGEPGDHFYVILEGEVEVVKSLVAPGDLGDQGERIIGTRGPGEFIGELALVNPDRHRTASVRCIQPTRLRQVTLGEFEGLIQRWPPLAYEMVRVLGARLTEAQSATIRDLREKNSLLTRAYAELQAAQAQIIAREKLERELQLAADIQRSILPRKMPRLKGYGFGARMVPARAVGGDFYDLIPLGRDRMGILIGDVTDKGVPSAIYMAQVHALIYAESWQGVSPGALLQRVNDLMLKINPSSLFATVLYGLLDSGSGVFSYARAGHERPLLCCQDGSPEVLPARPGQPLGLFKRPVLDEGDWLLPSGSSLFLYTDGVTDDRNPAGESFGLRNLSQAIAGTPRISAQAACDRLLEVLKRRRGEAEQDDDITLMCIQRKSN